MVLLTLVRRRALKAAFVARMEMKERVSMAEHTLKVGDTAPDFELPTDQGTRVKLSDFRGKRVVLYFYPKNDIITFLKARLRGCRSTQFLCVNS